MAGGNSLRGEGRLLFPWGLYGLPLWGGKGIVKGGPFPACFLASQGKMEAMISA